MKKRRILIVGLCIFLLITTVIFLGIRKRGQDDFLQAAETWYRYDEVRGEYETLRFYEDGTFYWGCECGEPVGASDVYEKYNFDQKTACIKVYNDFDDTSMEMEVLDYNDYHLLLKYDGRAKGYTSLNPEMDLTDGDKYLKGYSLEASIVKGNEESVVVGPFNYDGDIDYPENAFDKYVLGEDAKFYDLAVQTTIKDGVEEQSVRYEQLNFHEAQEMMEQSYGFLWFNKDMEVSKITFYGATVVET